MAVWVWLVWKHTHTHAGEVRCALTVLYSLMHKLQIQFKGLFFINLYLSGLIWLSKRAVFHYFPIHTHSQWALLWEKLRHIYFKQQFTCFQFLLGSLKHTRPIEDECGDFSRLIAVLGFIHTLTSEQKEFSATKRCEEFLLLKLLAYRMCKAQADCNSLPPYFSYCTASTD